MARVTVCIPTYKRARFLPETIQSVLNQTYQDFELLVTDDASPDNTAEVVAGFKDPRIHYFRHPHNLGMTANFRSAIEMARTQFVATLPDDDLLLPNHLSNALVALDAYPSAAFYACPAELFDNATGYMRPRAITDTQAPLIYIDPKQAVRFLGIDTPSPVHAVMRRSAFDVPLFWGGPSFYPFDALILIQLMAHGGFIFGNQASTRFRVHPGSTSSGGHDRLHTLRYNCMIWFAVRWLAGFLLDQGVCPPIAIEAHGMEAISHHHVVPLVLGLGSFDSRPVLREIAWRVFRARRDMDAASARFRLARYIGFWAIPLSEKISQRHCGWRP